MALKHPGSHAKARFYNRLSLPPRLKAGATEQSAEAGNILTLSSLAQGFLSIAKKDIVLFIKHANYLDFNKGGSYRYVYSP